MNLSEATTDEAVAYAHGYTDACTDLAPDLDELKRTCSTLTRQLAEAIAEANYYRTCSTLKPGIVRQLEHGITIDHNRQAWRHTYGLDQKGAAA